MSLSIQLVEDLQHYYYFGLDYIALTIRWTDRQEVRLQELKVVESRTLPWLQAQDVHVDRIQSPAAERFFVSPGTTVTMAS